MTLIRLCRSLGLATLLSLGGLPTLAAPLDECPSEAFLVQGAVAVMYGVDLATGRYRVLSSDLGTDKKLNALSFNFHDNYLYAWHYKTHTIARIGDDFQIEPLTLGVPFDSDFFVGDVALLENAMYLYRKGGYSQHGLWRVSLDPASPDYLMPIRITDGSSLWLNIYDFAFHPTDGFLYSVAANGDLIRIDTATGTSESFGNMGERGTYGAVYFDVDGNLYASRNSDGVIFRIDLNQAQPVGIRFAQGPASSNNDGARCALASVVSVDSEDVDYGDAPDSYGTFLESNGARHAVEGSTLYLGDGVDGEPQAYAAPLSDDTTGEDDEDGVTFITELTAGEVALIQVRAVGSGYLSGWIDYNRNGRFDANEKVLDSILLTTGTSVQSITVPYTAQAGNSWARFRFSTDSLIESGGGVADGEVEDYEVALRSGGVSTVYYPGSNSYVTLAYEDLWPSRGDYDMNDLVLRYRTSVNRVVTEQGEQVVGLSISGAVTAAGAAFHSGFAVAIPGLPAAIVDQQGLFFTIDGIARPSPLEGGHSEAVFVIFDDVWNVVTPAEGCSFYRTERFCGGSPVQANFELNVPLTAPISAAEVAENLLFNPFIFATPGYLRSSFFSSPPGRGLEIHLKNQPPTQLADTSLLGRADDRSDGVESFYTTESGLPYALEIGTEWQHPREYMDLLDAYPVFLDFVNSAGALGVDWYLPANADSSYLYED